MATKKIITRDWESIVLEKNMNHNNYFTVLRFFYEKLLF